MRFTPTIPELTEEMLNEQFGSEVTTYIKNGYYKEVTDATFMSYQLYRYPDTSIYYMNTVNDVTLWVVKTNSKPSADFEYEINDSNGGRTYYYSNELSLNPEYYVHFNYSSKDKITALMKSVYLRLTMTYPGFTVDVIATKIKKKKLNDNEFDYPKDKLLKVAE